MSQYKDIKLDHCQVVVDYMQSEIGNKINNKPEKCNQELTVQAQQNFQVRGKPNCSLFFIHNSNIRPAHKLLPLRHIRKLWTLRRK